MIAPSSAARARQLLLDADGVLQTNPPGWSDHLRAQVDPGRGEEFVDELWSAEQEAIRGRRPFADVLREVTARWGIGDRVEELLPHWHRVEAAEGTVEVVRELRAAGVPRHLVTNQNDHRAAYMRDGLGYAELFEQLFVSCELGLTKSDPGFFARVAERLDAPPASLLLVDDSQDHVDSAREAGLLAEVWCTEDGTDALRALLARHGLLPG